MSPSSGARRVGIAEISIEDMNFRAQNGPSLELVANLQTPNSGIRRQGAKTHYNVAKISLEIGLIPKHRRRIT